MERKNYLPTLFSRPGFPFGRIGDWQSEIEGFFDEFARRRKLATSNEFDQFNPSIDIAETNDAIDLTAELPGCEPKDVDISVTGQNLTIRGEKKAEAEKKDKNWHMVERAYGAFSRTIPLAFSPDPNKVEASFDKGVLKVHVVKPPEAKNETKKIAIKS